MRRALATRWIPVFMGLALSAGGVGAQTTFFGEDLPNPLFSPSASLSDRLYSFPNASAAQALFLSALTSDVGTETFESGFTQNQSGPINLTFPGAGSATLTGSGVVHRYSTGCVIGSNALANWCGNDRYPTSGDYFFDTPAGGDFQITFGQAVAAFGFFGVDVGDVGGRLFLDFIGDHGTYTWTVPHTLGSGQSTTGAVIYAGFVDADRPFTSVRFRNNSGSDLFAFDDMTIASVEQLQVVPEPSSFLLLATGLLGLVAVLRRRRA